MGRPQVAWLLPTGAVCSSTADGIMCVVRKGVDSPDSISFKSEGHPERGCKSTVLEVNRGGSSGAWPEQMARRDRSLGRDTRGSWPVDAGTWGFGSQELSLGREERARLKPTARKSSTQDVGHWQGRLGRWPDISVLSNSKHKTGDR